MATEKQKVIYEPKIISTKETYENSVDVSKLPIYTIENCEVLYSSLTATSPNFGHNIQILLPSDTSFVEKDKINRGKFLLLAQKEDDSIEFIKGMVKKYTQKDVLSGKVDEKLVNRNYMDFRISNSYTFDRTPQEDGTFKDVKVKDAKEAEHQAVVKYFRTIDKFSGEGIEPEVFKYENGEKITTFVSPKTKEITNIYVNKGDLVNIKLRPYVSKNQNTGELSLKYNLLSVEIVQTAWDRGIGKTGGSSKKVKETPEALSADSLEDLFDCFADSTEVTETKKTETKKTSKKTEKSEASKEELPFDEDTKSEEAELDFSALSNMNLDNLDLGE